MIPCPESTDYLDLDFLLDYDFVPQFNIQPDRRSINPVSSTDSSCQNDINFMDIDLESELEKFLNEQTEDPSTVTIHHSAAFDFELAELTNNNSRALEDCVKEETSSSDIITKADERGVKMAEDHDYCIVEPPVEYVRHFQPMPNNISPTPKRMTLTQSSIEPRTKGKEVVFLGRNIVQFNHHKPVHTHGGMKPLSQQIKGQVNGIKKIPPYTTHSSRLGGVTRLSPTAVLVRNPLARNPQVKQSNSRKGISILKRLPTLPGQTRINTTAAKMIKKQLSAPATLKAQGKLPTKSGWVTKEDPVKDMKNEQERMRRSELAKYRENVKNMLPHIRELDKVATVDILEMAKVYCLQLQNWASETEWERKLEYDWNNFLRTKLRNLIAEEDRACLPVKITGSEEKMAIDKLFESYDVEELCDFNY